MTNRPPRRAARAPSMSNLDRGRAWLGIAASLALVTLLVTGIPESGFAVALVVSCAQWVNLTVMRRDSASRKAGRPRFAPNAGPKGGSAPGLERAPPLFLAEELTTLMTSLGAVVLLCRALDVPIHPLSYVAGALLIALVLLFQLFPQLRARLPRAPKRTIVRPPSEWLN